MGLLCSASADLSDVPETTRLTLPSPGTESHSCNAGIYVLQQNVIFIFTKMIRLQKPRRVYVFPSLRTVNPKPFNHTQPSNPQKSLYLLPVCPFAVLLFLQLLYCSNTISRRGRFNCKTNPERVSRKAPAGVRAPVH